MAIRTSRGVFVHVPKTGGTWIQEVLRKSGQVVARSSKDHDTWEGIGQNPRLADWRTLTPFAFVRHPATWYQSYWAWKELDKWPKDDFLSHLKGTDFDSFIRNVLVEEQGYVGRLYERFTRGIRLVGRYETLRTGATFIFDELGITVDPYLLKRLPAVRVASRSPRWKPLCKWRPHLLRAILAFEKEALERWGYPSTL